MVEDTDFETSDLDQKSVLQRLRYNPMLRCAHSTDKLYQHTERNMCVLLMWPLEFPLHTGFA